MLRLLFLVAVAASATLKPAELTVDRRTCTSSSPIFVDLSTSAITVSWRLQCSSESAADCRASPSSESFVQLLDQSGTLKYSSNLMQTNSHMLSLSALSPDTSYQLSVTSLNSSSYCAIHTALVASATWPGASWISGGTEMRLKFDLPPQKTIARATLFASGLGCFSASINGDAVTGVERGIGAEMMDPGWSTIPNMRLLYRAYDVTASLRTGANVIGVRLGFCHYGYIDQAFCLNAHGMRDTCRGYIQVLSVQYTDGSRANVTSGKDWAVSTEANPMLYSHLYHGEVFDARKEQAGWDSDPNFTMNSQWKLAETYKANTAYEGPNQGIMSLMTMPAIGVAEKRTAISIRKQVLNPDLGRVVTYDGRMRSKPMLLVDSGYYYGTTLPTNETKTEENCKLQCNQTATCVQITWRVVPVKGLQQCVMYNTLNLNTQSDCPKTCKHYANCSGCSCCGASTLKTIRAWVYAQNPECPAGKQFPKGCTFFQLGNGAINYVSNVSAHCEPFGERRQLPFPAQVLSVNELSKLTVGADFTCAKLPDDCASPFKEKVTQWIYDFGENFAGITQISIKAPRGTAILVRHAEFLSPCGDVMPQQCPTATPSNSTMFEGGWPCAPTPLGPALLDQDQGGNQGNQTSLFITAGTGEAEVYSPSFSWYGVRYAAISGLPEEMVPTLDTLAVLRVNTLVEKVGNVSFPPKIREGVTLNRIQTAVLYTQQSNLHSHPEDCPQRERHGWTADSQVTSAEASLNFDMDLFYSNWLRTMRDIQILGCDVPNTTLLQSTPRKDLHNGAGKWTHPQSHWTFGAVKPLSDSLREGLPGGPDGHVRPPWFSCSKFWAPSLNASGAISDVVPWGGWPGGFPGDPNWAVAVVTVPWEVYRRTDNLDIVREHYQATLDYVRFLNRNAPAIQGWNMSDKLYLQATTGDWLCCDQLPNCGSYSDNGRCNTNCPKAAASAFAHMLGVSRVIDMAMALGHDEDASRFARQLADMKTTYHHEFFDTDAKVYVDRCSSSRPSIKRCGGSTAIHSLQVFPLYLGIVPEEHIPSVVHNLVDSIRDMGNHTNCGIIGSRFLLEVLTAHGFEDVAFALATQTTCPSWGYMVEGAGEPYATHETPGTIWESWQDLHEVGVSKNHPALAAGIGLWMYQLAGIDARTTSDQVVLRPLSVAVAKLGGASVKRGAVYFNWTATPGRFEAHVSVPFGSSVALHLPLPTKKQSGVVVVSEVGCDCDVWSSQGAFPQLPDGIQSATLSSDKSELKLQIVGGKWQFSATTRGLGSELLMVEQQFI